MSVHRLRVMADAAYADKFACLSDADRAAIAAVVGCCERAAVLLRRYLNTATNQDSVTEIDLSALHLLRELES